VVAGAPRPRCARPAPAGLTTRREDVVPFLVRQVTAPVRWTDCVRRMAAEGARTFLEVGPGRVLTGLLKRIDGALDGHAIDDPAGLDRAVAALGPESS